MAPSVSRRSVLGGTAGGLAMRPTPDHADDTTTPSNAPADSVAVALNINGSMFNLTLDPRTSLLDALREHADLIGTKKGCDRGACGACTVHIDGRRVLSCLTLAARCQGRAITTIEGVAGDNDLHPVQAAFLRHDGLQCGYCTPGQIMSAVALIKEGHTSSDSEIREWMSGNICRCGAYPNIVAAVRDAARER